MQIFHNLYTLFFTDNKIVAVRIADVFDSLLLGILFIWKTP